jgi:primosomal replication protein N''
MVDAEKVIVRYVPDFIDSKDPNQIASLEQALEYEIQLRHDCRSLEDVRRDLGLTQINLNLPQPDLLSAIHLLLEQFDQVASVVKAIRDCPLQIEASDVFRSGQPERISAFIHSLNRGIRRQKLRHRSRLLLQDLTLWCERNWLDTLEQRIDRDLQVGVELEPVARECPRLVDFQLYRSRAEVLSTTEQSVMQVLAAARNHWQALAPENLSETIRITVEREALLGWQAEAESQEPALLLTRQDVDRRIKRLEEQDAHLLDLNRRITATPATPERVQPRPNWDDIVMLQGPRARKLREVVELGEERGLFEICPVWLVNPETVSQIFPLRQGLFDLVIFDEASQLPVENALPAMYRANRIVISGDEKQLPPTRFFSSGFADESDEDFNPDTDGDDPEILADAVNAAETRRQVKDCGDLLVLASAAGLTHVSLDIHYRSRFRPLIAHSNAAFYQNKLSVPVLHPAEEIRRTRPLQVEVINGTYANQSNRDEAVALIAFLEDLWCGPHAAEHDTLPTVGVVTFNKTQADLIEDLLDRYTQKNRQFQQILERERQRRFQGEDCGFFVKNLENVQGDERDWILFSTTFGRDGTGRFMRRFGALGMKGGERRLNVATSRARDKVVIFSSMPIEEISDAHRQCKTPLRPRDFLQSYLLYASAISEGHLDEAEALLNRLHRPSSTRIAASTRHSQRYFVQCVAEYLRKKGFEVSVPAVGDAFAFDLALSSPATGLFVLGIECDPPRHPDLAHARDREIWRPRVLESSLPNVHRVWSRLWLIEPAREQRRLNDAVRKALPSPSPAP